MMNLKHSRSSNHGHCKTIGVSGNPFTYQRDLKEIDVNDNDDTWDNGSQLLAGYLLSEEGQS